mgnify:CR=1 FL=1
MSCVSTTARFNLLNDVEHFNWLYLSDRPITNWRAEVFEHPAVERASQIARLIGFGCWLIGLVIFAAA